ncbi:MAG: 4a-hydroxytetrahydrobiopterin dehydratase [Zoogloeaceae bacterium]|nr:4a-hydroxytetrahydrobiopterin dehydratase [Zoogloeaceae bacterium]
MAPSIFISYRRSDAQHAAFALAERLGRVFGEDEVFLDRTRIETGAPWPQRLEESVGAARVVLALIGPGWLRADDEWGRRRIDQKADWVRAELATALTGNKAVLPLLLGKADMPPKEALPPSLAALPDQNARSLHDDTWVDNLAGLIDELVKHHGLRRLEAPQAAPVGALTRPRVEIVLPALSDEEVRQKLIAQGLAHWQIDHLPHPWVVVGQAQELYRVYPFDGFLKATDFMAVAARAIVRQKPQHHPRWQNQWTSVQVWFSTWDVGCRITELDLKAAKQIEDCYWDFLNGRLARPHFDPPPTPGAPGG